MISSSSGRDGTGVPFCTGASSTSSGVTLGEAALAFDGGTGKLEDGLDMLATKGSSISTLYEHSAEVYALSATTSQSPQLIDVQVIS